MYEYVNPQWLVFGGIVLEIIGFVLMNYRFKNLPTVADYNRWKEMNCHTHVGWFRNADNFVSITLDNVNVIEGITYKTGLYQKVPKQFKNYWRNRVKVAPIGFVIAGLILQGISTLFFF